MRQYVASTEPSADGQLCLNAKDAKYITRVLRLREGGVLDVRHLDGRLVTMTLDKVQGEWLLLPSKDLKNKGETGVRAKDIQVEFFEFILLQFLPKPKKMDLIIRQASECGLTSIYPVLGDFSNVHDAPQRSDRWERVIKEARQQSGSSIATQVYGVQPIEDVLNSLKAKSYEDGSFCENTTLKIVLSEVSNESFSIFEILKEKKQKPKKVILAVGCEGGFSEKEFGLLTDDGFEKLHFKINVLRSETAALYGMAVIQNAVTEYKSWLKQE